MINLQKVAKTIGRSIYRSSFSSSSVSVAASQIKKPEPALEDKNDPQLLNSGQQKSKSMYNNVLFFVIILVNICDF